MRILEKSKIWLTFKNKREEKEYAEERATICMNWLKTQNLHYVLYFLGAAFLDLYYRFQTSNPRLTGNIVIIIQLFGWCFLYAAVFGIEKLISKGTIPRLLLCCSVCLAGHILCFITLPLIKGTPYFVFTSLYIIHSYIYCMNISRIWFLQILISFPFYIYHIYGMWQRLNESPENTLVIELIVGNLLWILVRSYKDETSYRDIFALKQQIQREKEELQNFLQITPLIVIQYNLITKYSILNPKGVHLISDLDCPNFQHFASRMKLKEHQSINLQRFMEGKAAQFKRSLQQNNQNKASHPDLECASEDFIYKKSIKASTPNRLKTKKKKEFEVHFYWKEADPDNVTLLIEEKGQKEKLREEKVASRCKDIMFRAMSHNLKTPLNGISTLLEELCRKSPTLENRVMLMNTRFLESKIDDIQDFTTIECGSFEQKIGAFDVSVFLKEIKEICSIQAELDHIQIAVQKRGSVPNIIRGDRKRLGQILIHLFQNGIKYSEKRNKVTLYVKNIKQDEQIEFGVHNYCPVIQPSQQFTIFDFLNMHESNQEISSDPSNLHEDKNLTTTSFSLPITQQIAKSIGSTLNLSSTRQGGTTFYFKMNIKESNSTGVQTSRIKFSPKKQGVPKSTILNIRHNKLSDSKINPIKNNLLLERFEKEISLKCKTKILNINPIINNNRAKVPGDCLNNGNNSTNKGRKRRKEENIEERKERRNITDNIVIQNMTNSEKKIRERSPNIPESIIRARKRLQNIPPNNTENEMEIEDNINDSPGLQESSKKNYFQLIQFMGNARKDLESGKVLISRSPGSQNSSLNFQSQHSRHYSDIGGNPNIFPFLAHVHNNPGRIALSVEDNGVNRLVIRRLLEKRGFVVEEAFNGKEAMEIIIDKIEHNNIGSVSMVFMDLNMPIMNGLECASEMIKMMREGHIPHIPVFALTAHDTKQLENKCLEIGFSHFLTKPIKVDKLDILLRNHNLM